MKKVMVVLMAVSMFATTVPAFAMEHTGSAADVQCAKDCDLFLKDCSKEVDSIQQRIKKLKASIKKNGADQTKLKEITALKLKLDDANATLKTLEKQ